MEQKIEQTLVDDHTDLKSKATVMANPHGVVIALEGSRHCLSDDVVLVEAYDGKLVVRVWATPDNENPSHVIEIPQLSTVETEA